MFLKHSKGTAIAGNVITTLMANDTQINQFLYGNVILNTDVTVANRRVIISIRDKAGGIVMESRAGAVVAALAASQFHGMFPGAPRETAIVGGALQMPIPHDFFIPPGYSAKISIENGVAGDSYSYSIMFKINHAEPTQIMLN